MKPYRVTVKSGEFKGVKGIAIKRTTSMLGVLITVELDSGYKIAFWEGMLRRDR